VTTTYTLLDVDNTPFDNNDNPVLKTQTFGAGDSTTLNRWVSLHTIASPEAGQYFLRVTTAANQPNSQASNGFGIRARVGSTFAVCTTVPSDPGYSASCPQIHGVDDMSIYANDQSGTGQASFYLAEVDAVHAGKHMAVDLFDTGEGALSIEVLDPNGNVRSFSWSTPCSPPTPPTGGCSGSGSSLSVGGSGTQPYPNLKSTSKYNDRRITLDVQLPSDYAARYGARKWWRIRYRTSTTSVTDRTTWSVRIVGDPVHLVTEN
jgi:hypothetical protein